MSSVRLCAIVGMHRSGTSLVARGVNLLGFSLGDPRDLVAAGPDNPLGFWESRRIVSFHDQLLLALGGTWDAPPQLPPGWQDDTGRPRHELDALVEEVFSEQDDSVAWKDPRGSLLLPYWGDRIHHTLLVVRSPDEVHASLERRNGIDSAWADYLWLRYVAHAVTEAHDPMLVPYTAVLRSPAEWFERFADRLGVPDVAGRIDEFLEHVDPSERHERGTERGASSGGLAAELYEGLMNDPNDDLRATLRLIASGDWARAGDPRVREIGAVHEQLERVRVALRPMIPIRARWRELTTEIGLRDEKLELLNERVLRLREEVGALEESRLRARGALRSEQQKVRQLEARLRVTVNALERQRLLLGRAEARVAESRRKGLALEEELQHVVDDLRQTAALRKDVSRQLRRTREELRRVRSRRSVRAALKLASLWGSLTRHEHGVAQPETAAAPGSDAHSAADPPERDTSAVRPADLRQPMVFDPTGAPMHDEVTIVVPIYDSPHELRRCLDALLRNTTSPARVLLIDDASSLDETRELLAEYERFPAVTLLRNDENLGFTRSVNRGLEACATDVVILNSDTEVPPRWLHALRIAAYSDVDVGSATAVSDDAGAFSVPVIGERNVVPPALGVDAAGRAIARSAGWNLPETPTGNGFCMYLRRSMLDQVGLLDAEAFPVGYGEENDLCMRARRAGWRHVVADAVFVRHAKGSSFGSERRKLLIAAGRAVIDERFPDYTDLVRGFVGSDAMEQVRSTAKAALWEGANETTPTGGPRVLYVLHEGRGGTPATSLDLAVELSDRYDSLMLTNDSRSLRLSRIGPDGMEMLEEYELDRPIAFAEHRREDVRRLLADIMVRHSVEVVHVRHIVKGTVDVFDVAWDLDIPYIVSFHDFYMSCPTVHLLDDQDHFCGGLCTPGDGHCRIPMQWIAETAPHLKHAGVYEWRDLLRPSLERASALVTTSAVARDVYLRSYPSLDPAKFQLIEHGRDLDRTPIGWVPPEPHEAIRVLIPGNLDVHKGSDLVRRLLAADTERRLEFHQLGERDDDSTLGVVAHGAYARDEFARRVEEIQPHMIGIFATWAETYNHTLSEAWMTGVPVVATDIGALGERIRAHGGGFLIPPDDPDAGLQRIFEMADDTAALVAATELSGTAVRSVAAMAEDYDNLYRAVVAGRRALDPGPPLRIALMALGRRSEAPGSVQVRSLRPLSHPALYGDVAVRMATAEDVIAGRIDMDVAIVQRTALSKEQVPRFLSFCQERGIPLIVEVDDLIFDADLLPDNSDQEWNEHVEALRILMREADLVTVSTPAVAEAAFMLNPGVSLLPNHIDERLWFTDVSGDDGFTAPSDPVRLFYMGSRTHHADLELLRPVVEGLRVRLDRPVQLDVVGGTKEPAEWFNRIRVPAGSANYPSFARWLSTVAPGHAVALAPLVDSSFTRAKSDLKWLEYTALGLPGIFSDLDPYATVRDGETGLLVPNEHHAWTEAILRILDDVEFGRALVANARAEIVADRVLDRRVRERLGVYAGLVQAASVDQRRLLP